MEVEKRRKKDGDRSEGFILMGVNRGREERPKEDHSNNQTHVRGNKLEERGRCSCLDSDNLLTWQYSDCHGPHCLLFTVSQLLFYPATL